MAVDVDAALQQIFSEERLLLPVQGQCAADVVCPVVRQPVALDVLRCIGMELRLAVPAEQAGPGVLRPGQVVHRSRSVSFCSVTTYPLIGFFCADTVIASSSSAAVKICFIVVGVILFLVVNSSIFSLLFENQKTVPDSMYFSFLY